MCVADSLGLIRLAEMTMRYSDLDPRTGSQLGHLRLHYDQEKIRRSIRSLVAICDDGTTLCFDADLSPSIWTVPAANVQPTPVIPTS